jgi:multicomponent Na+:H+ antiporter subunit B
MIQSSYDSIIVRRIGTILVPLVQLFALYVLVFGQYGPGGGFVAGVMIGASLIMELLVFGREGATPTRAKRALTGDGAGLLVFAFVGGLGLIGGGEFLNYSDMPLPGIDDASRRYLGILLTQAGVAIDVAVAAVSIVFSLWGNGGGGPDA